MLCYIRRRRRTQQLEHDTAVASTLAAAGYNRRPLDGDDPHDENKDMTQRFSSGPLGASPTISSLPSASIASGARLSSGTAFLEDLGTASSTPGIDFDPYAAYGTVHPPPAVVAGGSLLPTRQDGYVPARTGSPPPGTWQRTHTHSTSTSASSMGMGMGYTPSHGQKGSVGSHEPLLAAYYAGGGAADAGASGAAEGPPAIPPRNPLRVSLDERLRGGAASAAVGPSKRESIISTDSTYSEEPGTPVEDRPKLQVRGPRMVDEGWRLMILRCRCGMLRTQMM